MRSERKMVRSAVVGLIRKLHLSIPLQCMTRPTDTTGWDLQACRYQVSIPYSSRSESNGNGKSRNFRQVSLQSRSFCCMPLEWADVGDSQYRIPQADDFSQYFETQQIPSFFPSRFFLILQETSPARRILSHGSRSQHVHRRRIKRIHLCRYSSEDFRPQRSHRRRYWSPHLER